MATRIVAGTVEGGDWCDTDDQRQDLAHRCVGHEPDFWNTFHAHKIFWNTFHAHKIYENGGSVPPLHPLYNRTNHFVTCDSELCVKCRGVDDFDHFCLPSQNSTSGAMVCAPEGRIRKKNRGQMARGCGQRALALAPAQKGPEGGILRLHSLRLSDAL